ncbi:MAG: ABC transporter ATP-binding protein, partial [Roseburia sp.]|nr:ABC transporter ATP-binding protein [Roseburia sp.]
MARNRYDMDEVLEDSFDVGQLKRLAAYISPYKTKMAGVIVLMLTSSALTMAIPIFLQLIMDKSIPAGDMKSIWIYSGLTLLIAVYSALALRIKIKTMSVIGQNIVHDIRRDIFWHLQELPFSYYDDRPHGKIQVRVVNYVNSLSDLLSNGIINTFTDLCNLIFILVFMFALDVRLTLVCLCGLPLLVLVIVFIKKRQRKAWQIQSNKQSNLNAYIAESINGIRVTQSFVREQENTGIFNHLSANYRSSWMKAVTYNFTMGPAVDVISTLTTAFIYVLGVKMILAPDMTLTVGVLVAFTAYIGRFWAPINTLAGFYNSLLTAISYLERIFETIDEPVKVKDAPDAVPMPPVKGEVEFRHVTFGYEPGQKILNDISFTAKEGESYAIVGPTGAGKTTIVNLISRFYNVDSGEILIDGTDISKVTLHSLRSQMGIMMQDSFIFSGTIMDNIRYGNRDATDEEVIRAAKTVCAHDFIMEMEQGYETEVNERGSRLSAGQRQLISFARALLADPKILILDEATSSIDT